MGEDRLEEAKSMFEHCQDHFSNDNVFDVEFSGIGSFGNRVLFAKPSGNIERIVRLSETFQAKYSEQNFQCEFKLDPHLTLFKVKAKRKALKKSLLPHTTAWKITALEFNLSEQSSYYK